MSTSWPRPGRSSQQRRRYNICQLGRCESKTGAVDRGGITSHHGDRVVLNPQPIPMIPMISRIMPGRTTCVAPRACGDAARPRQNNVSTARMRSVLKSSAGRDRRRFENTAAARTRCRTRGLTAGATRCRIATNPEQWNIVGVPLPLRVAATPKPEQKSRGTTPIGRQMGLPTCPGIEVDGLIGSR